MRLLHLQEVPPIIAQAPEGAGRDEAHRCDSHEGDGRIRRKAIGQEIGRSDEEGDRKDRRSEDQIGKEIGKMGDQTRKEIGKTGDETRKEMRTPLTGRCLRKKPPK